MGADATFEAVADATHPEIWGLSVAKHLCYPAQPLCRCTARGLGVVTRDMDGFTKTGIQAVNPWVANDVTFGERGT